MTGSLKAAPVFAAAIVGDIRPDFRTGCLLSRDRHGCPVTLFPSRNGAYSSIYVPWSRGTAFAKEK
jgi:hypothetical protein